MHDARWPRVVMTMLTVVLPATANATPAGIYVTESDAGSVVRLGAGGALDDVPRFATGLDGPQGLCVGPGANIYVAERDAGEITIITSGGDFTDAAPWAHGSVAPVGLACNASRVLVVDASGVVLDVSAGGDLDETAVVFATGIVGPVDLLMRNAIVWVSGNGALNISAGGDFTGVPPFASGQIGALTAFTGLRLAGSMVAPRIEDWGVGGDVGALAPYATLPGGDAASVDGLLATGDGRLLALVDGVVYDAAAGGDLTAAAPLATGVGVGATGFEGMLEHLCEYNVDCDDNDVCTGAESCAETVCIAGTPLVCDDGDACTVDACDPIDGCTAVAIDDCCSTDDECAIDELCDVAQHECVPLVVPGQSTSDGGDDSGAGTDGGGATTVGTAGGTAAPPTDDTDGSTGEGPAADGDVDAAACACSQSSGTGGPAWLLLAIAWLTARRRRR